jgi:hypothetical protein
MVVLTAGVWLADGVGVALGVTTGLGLTDVGVDLGVAVGVGVTFGDCVGVEQCLLWILGLSVTSSLQGLKSFLSWLPVARAVPVPAIISNAIANGKRAFIWSGPLIALSLTRCAGRPLRLPRTYLLSWTVSILEIVDRPSYPQGGRGGGQLSIIRRPRLTAQPMSALAYRTRLWA